MKQQLWILNSSLIIIFAAIFSFNLVLKQEIPLLRTRRIEIEEPQKKKAPIIISIDKILKQDLFDTYISIEERPIKQSLVTPIPEPKPPVFTPPSEPQKLEFIPPLNITLKGIISSSEEEKSVAMIADETNKEKVYHLGSMIKDGQILKLAKNKVVLIRANGQQETYLLRKEEDKIDATSPERWKCVVKKVDDQNYEIDPQEFGKEIQSLGELIEELSLGTAYQKGAPIGLKIGNVDPNEIGTALGLNQNDIIKAINNINTNDIKNRIKIYDALIQLKKGDIIKVTLNRNNQDTLLSYKLVKLEKPKKQAFIQPAKEGVQPPETSPMSQFKMSGLQEREKQLREFKRSHKSPKQQQVISDIRQRLLDNMRSRSTNRRVR